MAVHVKKEPWPAIKQAVEAAKGRIVAASGYVGKGAFEHLPLREGDILVCDCSPTTVSSGATNPSALLPFIKAGVEVYSKPGLHAKVIVLPKRAFIGSANASDNSARRLFEAVLETTNTADIQALREFVLELCTSPVTKRTVEERKNRYPKNPRQGAAATDPAKLPEHLQRIVLVGLTREDWTAQEQAAFDKGKEAAVDKARNTSSAYALDSFALSTSHKPEISEGEWVVMVTDGVPEAPSVVVHRESHGKRGIVWVATPKEAVALQGADSLGLAVPLKRGEIRHVNGSEAQRVLDLHRSARR